MRGKFDSSTLAEYEAEIRKRYPGFGVSFKIRSKSQRLLAKLLGPVDPQYLLRSSTSYPKVFFPMKDTFLGKPRVSFGVMSHELSHLSGRHRSIWYTFKYFFPQALAPVLLIAYELLAMARSHSLSPVFLIFLMVFGYLFSLPSLKTSPSVGRSLLVGTAFLTGMLSGFLGGGYGALVLAAFACLLPWPSPWRLSFELRAHSMSLAILCWVYGIDPRLNAGALVDKLHAEHYYGMAWSRRNTTIRLYEKADDIQSGKLLREDDLFRFVHSFLQARGLLYDGDDHE